MARYPRSRTAGLRPRMAWLHGWVGLLAGWVLYAICLTGTLSYFQDEISTWMRPELPRRQAPLAADAYVQQVASTLTNVAPHARRWIIDLPSPRRPGATASWVTATGHGERVFDAASGAPAPVRDTAGAGLFYRFHYQLHYLPHVWGRWIVGLCTLLMLVALVSGLITHRKIFTEFFTFRGKRGARSWLDAHNALSVLALPFHLMISYSGLVMLAFLYMPWGGTVAYPQAGERQAALLAATSAPLRWMAPSGQAEPLPDLGAMVRAAQARWGPGELGTVIVHNPGDANSGIVLMRGETRRVSGDVHYLLFRGADGLLLQARERAGAWAEARGMLYGLHMGRFGDTVVRWLYLLCGLAATAMTGTGLVLWTLRRTGPPRGQDSGLGPALAARLNVAVIAGLSVATAAYFCLNRLLPPDWASRRDWEVHGFFLAWAGMLAHALARPAGRAWIEQLCLASVLLGLAPPLSALTTGRTWWRSLHQGDWLYAGVELSLWALALAHALLAWRIARHDRGDRPAHEPKPIRSDTVATAGAPHAD